jgi:hypothetical protein
MKKIELSEGTKKGLSKVGMTIFEKWQKYHSKQNTMTPVDVIVNILNNTDIDDKDVVVVSNCDVFKMIETLVTLQYVFPKSLTLVTDVKALAGKPYVIYVESFKEIDLKKRFDVGILNPPYVHGKASQIGYKIVNQVYQCTDRVVAILPNNQLLKLAEMTTGFQAAVDCAHHFKCYASIKNGLSYGVFDKFESTKSFDSILGHTLPKYDNSLFNVIKKSHPIVPARIKVIETPNGEINAIKSTTGMYSVDLTHNYVNDPYLHTYRVAVNMLGGHPLTRRKQITQNKKVTTSSTGKAVIVKPGTAIIGDMRFIVCSDETQAAKVAEYIMSPVVQDIMAFSKMQQINAEKYFEYVPLPDFLK